MRNSASEPVEKEEKKIYAIVNHTAQWSTLLFWVILLFDAYVLYYLCICVL